MLEKINLDLKLSRETYEHLLPGFQRRLYDLEKACWDAKVASILVFEGWDAAGKGSAISELTSRMDPRGFRLHPIQPPRTLESKHPWLWRFWMRLPSYGEMAIFDRSWYRRVLDERVEGGLSKQDRQRAFHDIVEFERMLSDDGVVIVKFWLHISKKEQRKRFKAIEGDPLESWHVTREDWARHKLYGKYLDAAEQMLELTDSENAPWVIVEATSKSYAHRKIFETVIRSLEQRLGPAAPATQEAARPLRASARRKLHA
jgi:polyphosphate kinase 2 (PPK2 family)